MRDRLVRMFRGDRRRLAWLCLAINLAVLAGIALRNPAYLVDFRLNDSPDARHYVQLGRNLLLEGHYSRMEEPPFAPDMLRTPVYPILAGGLDIATGPVGIYLAQAAIQIWIVLLLYRLAALYFGARAAFWVGLLAATDLMLAVYNHGALTEPLFAALTLYALTLLLPRLLPPDSRTGGGLAGYAVAGTALALATLTRPAGLYLPLGLAVAALWFVGRREGWRLATRAACLVLIPSVVLVGGWILRNQRQFGIAKVTYVDAVGTVYMAGAGAYQVHHGVSRSEAQRMIAAEFGLPTLLEMQNPWLLGEEIHEMDARLRRASPQVLSRYPGDLVVSSLLGVIKGSLSHNVAALAILHGRDWTAPGLGELLRFRSAAFGRLFSNHPALISAFAWQVAHVLVTLALALLGVWHLGRSRSFRPFALVLLVVVAYFALGMALFGLDAYYRSRIPMLPYLYLLAGVGGSRLLALRASDPG